MPEITIPERTSGPLIACTRAELARLRAAFKRNEGAVTSVVRRADKALDRAVEFPPRGGQHNQWYQCEPCQMGLQKLSDSRHKCPKCEKVYSGAPYDDAIFSKKHRANISNARNAAWAYALTGRKKYARYAASILLGYAERYLTYEYHNNRCRTGKKASRSGGRLFEQTLGEAQHLSAEIAPAFDLVFSALSAEERKQIRQGLILPMVRNIDKCKSGISNWQTWHNAGMICGGALLEDASWVRKALTGK